MKILWILSISMLLTMVACPIQAEIFKWTDDKGGVHFTEDPSTIPEKYLDTTKSRPTQEDGMTSEQRRQENKRSEAEAAKQGEKERAGYQKSIKEDEIKTRERQLKDQAEEKQVIPEGQEKTRKSKELQIENAPAYVKEGCQACFGKGQIRCYNCKGTGYDLALRRRCPFCEGAGWKRCSNRNGKGYISKRIK